MNRNVWSVLVITMTILLLVTATASAAPGIGRANAWGRVARDMQEERTPGSIASLVHALKAGSVDAEMPAVDNEADEGEAEELETFIPVLVVVVEIIPQADDETVFTVKVGLPVEEGEDNIYLEVQVEAELADLLEEGTELLLDKDEAGNYVLRMPDSEESQQESVDE